MKSHTIPPIIWCFWHDGHPPALVEACMRNMTALYRVSFFIQKPATNPECTLQLLTSANIPDESERPELHRLSSQHQADWLRLDFLRRWGGIWMDATMVTFVPLCGANGWVDRFHGAELPPG